MGVAPPHHQEMLTSSGSGRHGDHRGEGRRGLGVRWEVRWGLRGVGVMVMMGGVVVMGGGGRVGAGAGGEDSRGEGGANGGG